MGEHSKGLVLFFTGVLVVCLVCLIAGCVRQTATVSSPEAAAGELTRPTEPKVEPNPDPVGSVPPGHDGVVAVLMYHHLTTRGNWGGNDAVVVVDDFAEHMAYLKKEGYNVVSLRQVADFYRHGIPLPPKPVAITFDDGYESTYQLAYPILKRYDFPFTVFIVVNWIGEETTGPFRPEQKELISWPQLLEMYESGLCNVQPHTFDAHYRFSDGGYPIAHARSDQIFADLEQAKTVLEDRLGHQVFALTYPWGVYSPATLQVADKLGYEVAFTMTQGANPRQADPRTLLRTGVLQSDGVAGFPKKLAAQRQAALARQ
ncbi:MAG: polysaccharide deacetylase family protein [Heliobacteriaceae bacterium]|nr:polysaccharide deacetylase family protein [Heliobacteriaceae bacterium]